MLSFDHIAVTAPTLDSGVLAVEIALGVPLASGGAHPVMGTHNRLLSLGPTEYLEVITVDPAAPEPGRARWFGLDTPPAAPRLGNWITRCRGIGAECAKGPPGSGTPVALSRGDLHWQMAVPEDGYLPFDGLFPALIEWPKGAHHPAGKLPDHGLRLIGLEIRHPQAKQLRDMLAGRMDEPRLRFATAPEPELRAIIDTPGGPTVLT